MHSRAPGWPGRRFLVVGSSGCRRKQGRTNPLYVWQTLIRPEKLAFALQILVPLAFLPVRGRWLWLSVVPGASFTLLTTAYPPTIQITFQYLMAFISLIFPAAALALAARRPCAPALIALLSGTILTTAAWGAIPPRAHFRGGFAEIDFRPVTAAERRKHQDLVELAALAPPDAALAVSSAELPHVARRTQCYDLRGGYQEADFILYADGSGSFGADHAARALATGEYREVARRPGLVLLSRK